MLRWAEENFIICGPVCAFCFQWSVVFMLSSSRKIKPFIGAVGDYVALYLFIHLFTLRYLTVIIVHT